MADERGLFVREVETSPDVWVGTDPLQARLAMSGLLAATSAFGARPGVISGCVVSGTTSTSPWRYSVSAGPLATSKSAGDGVVLRAISSASLVETSPAPMSGSRVDIIYAAHNDVDASDPNNNPVLDVAQGDVGSPGLPPLLPPGAIELGRATVAAGVTNTQGATFDHSFVQYTATRGSAIPVTGLAQRDALSGLASLTNPITVHRRDTGRMERNVGGGWYDIDGQPWAGYTPVLTATAPNHPVLGSGSSATGRWGRSSGRIDGNFDVTFGSTGTNAGSGEYFISLPVSAAAGAAGKAIGSAWLLGTGAWALGVVFAVGGSLARIRLATNVTVNSTNPWAWGANHALRGNYTYEV